MPVGGVGNFDFVLTIVVYWNSQSLAGWLPVSDCVRLFRLPFDGSPF